MIFKPGDKVIITACNVYPELNGAKGVVYSLKAYVTPWVPVEFPFEAKEMGLHTGGKGDGRRCRRYFKETELKSLEKIETFNDPEYESLLV